MGEILVWVSFAGLLPAYCKVCNKPSGLRSIEYIKSNLIILILALMCLYLAVTHLAFWILGVISSCFVGRLYFLFASKLHIVSDDEVLESKSMAAYFWS